MFDVRKQCIYCLFLLLLCLFSDLEILYFFRKCVMRLLPYNSENMDCWKSLPIVRKELMLDHCWKFKNDHWFQEKLNLCTILVRKQIATIAQLELLGNTPLNQHGNCSCLSKLVVLRGRFFFLLDPQETVQMSIKVTLWNNRCVWTSERRFLHCGSLTSDSGNGCLTEDICRESIWDYETNYPNYFPLCCSFPSTGSVSRLLFLF